MADHCNGGAFVDLAGAAGRTAGTLLHARKHESLSFHKIDGGRVQHLVRALLKKELQTVLLKSDVALYCRFGYVHSQRRASAAGNNENPHPVPCFPLFLYNRFKLLYRAVRQAYHKSSWLHAEP